MGSLPRPPAGSRLRAGSFLPGTSGHTNIPSCDGPATRADVLLALTYGLELVHHGAMLVAKGGRPQLANRAALSILQKKTEFHWPTQDWSQIAPQICVFCKLLEETIHAPKSEEPRESPAILERKSALSALMVRFVPGPGAGEPAGARTRKPLL